MLYCVFNWKMSSCTYHSVAAAAAAAAKQIFTTLSLHVFLIKIVNHKDQGEINWWPYRTSNEIRDEEEKTSSNGKKRRKINKESNALDLWKNKWGTYITHSRIRNGNSETKNAVTCMIENERVRVRQKKAAASFMRVENYKNINTAFKMCVWANAKAIAMQ